MNRIFYVLLFMSLYGCNNEDTNLPLKTDPSTLRTLQQGELIGTRGRDNARAWYGIPFAAAPVGELRWRAPRAAPQWQGRLEATTKSHRCPQYAMEETVTGSAEPPGPFVGKEDCLYLNIWAPPQHTSSDTKLPVMFWIHGGGNFWGYGGQYEMGRLATSQNVVVISVNYRLGPLGWFAHESIRSTAQNPIDHSANFATLDLIHALDWVSDNISTFGGDKNNITVFGESAGGFNTASLIASPLAKGKFHKAIVQSGNFETHTLQEAEFGPESEQYRNGTASNEAIAVMSGLPTNFKQLTPKEQAEWLRKQSIENIFASYNSLLTAEIAIGGYDAIDITADDIVIPIGGIKNVLSDPSRYNLVPTIMGTTRDELRIASFLNKDLTKDFLGIIFWAKNLDLYQAFSEYPSRLWRAYGAEMPAKAMVTGGNQQVFTYRFDWDEQGTVFFTDLSELMGAAHSLEMAFVLGGFEDKVNDLMGLSFNKKNKAAREQLSQSMMSYWANFAYTSSPGKGRDNTLTEWPAWTPGENTTKAMIFDTEQDGGIRTSNDTSNISQILAQLRVDPRFKDDTIRCKAFETIAAFTPFLYKEIETDINHYCKRQ